MKKILRRALSSFIVLYSTSRKERKETLIESLQKLKEGLARESSETKAMLQIYNKHLKGQATAEEMARANQQFRDLIKGLGLSVFLFLPFAPITIPFIVTLGKKLGVEIIPTGFRDTEQSEQADVDKETPEY